MAPFAKTRSSRPSLSRSAHEAPQPASVVSRACANRGRASAKADPGAVALEDAVELAMRVGHEEVGPPVAARVCGGDAHAGVLVGDAGLGPALLEAEAERALGWNVHVEPVRVEVVGDVEVEATVAVDVGERGAEAVLDLPRLDADVGSDVAEARAPVRPCSEVEVEPVRHARVGGGKASGIARDRRVEVGVACDEQIRAPIGVHVADRRGRVPAVGVDPGGAGALDELAAALVPEQRVVAGRGDVEVGAPVAVEVGGDAAVPAQVEVGAGAAAHVDEPARRRFGRARCAAGRPAPSSGRRRPRSSTS